MQSFYKPTTSSPLGIETISGQRRTFLKVGVKRKGKNHSRVHHKEGETALGVTSREPLLLMITTTAK